MIIANEIPITPTIFPDGTSQVWKLPESLMDAYEVHVEWRFHNEREIFDLLALRRILYSHPMSLHMPYLPFGRQDKEVDNQSTFNLEILADLLNGMRFSEVTSVDTHNIIRTQQLIRNYRNIPPDWDCLISGIDPDLIVFPDDGAEMRYEYPTFRDWITLQKERDQSSGKISMYFPIVTKAKKYFRALILDDICDGGGTFIMAADLLRKHIDPNLEVSLLVTHGIFSKGIEIFKKNKIGVNCLFYQGRKRDTTDSIQGLL